MNKFVCLGLATLLYSCNFVFDPVCQDGDCDVEDAGSDTGATQDVFRTYQEPVDASSDRAPNTSPVLTSKPWPLPMPEPDPIRN